MEDSKSISPAVAMAVGLGAIIGAGIFVLSGTALALAGSLALLAFILVGIVALLVAFEIGELGSIMPHAKGAAYSYVFSAFGSELGFITGILLYFSFANAIPVVALGFGSYFASMLGISTSFVIPFAMLLIFVLAVVNLLGIKKAAKADSMLVVVKVAILGIFIAFALAFAVGSGATVYSHFSIVPSKDSVAAIFAASVVIFFAFSGFQTISTFTARIRGGPRAAAKAVIGAVVVSMILYVLVVLGLMFLAPASSYGISGDPLSFALNASHAPRYLFYVVDIGALIATASATLAMMLSASRVMYQIGEDKLLPRIVRKYNPKIDVASNAVIISAVIGVVTLFAGNIYVIAAISNFGLLFSYLMTSLALMHFRRIKAQAEFRAPFYPYLPIVAIVAIIAFMYGMPQESLVVGVGLVLSLIVVYYFLRELLGKKVVRIRLFR